MKIDTSSPVCVTGATGYVGGVLVQQLLEAGATVHCPVRDPTNQAKVQHLKDLPNGANIKFFTADLLDQGSYLESIKNCSVVFHVASPFFMNVPPGKEQEMLLDPAVKGTINVLESATQVSSVKRVVLTSSTMAVACDGYSCVEVRNKTGKMINEESWNEAASEEYQPYAFSKVLAEKAAWEFVKKQENCNFDMVACNPSFVMGPGVKVFKTSESYQFIQSFGTGMLRAGCPDIGMAFVDVRDVARGHIAAGFLPSEAVANQRFILSGTNSAMISVGQELATKYPNYPFPTSSIPKWLFWCIAPYIGLTRKYASRSVGYMYEMDNAKSLRDLQLGKYRSLTETMNEMFQQCLDNGFIAKMV